MEKVQNTSIDAENNKQNIEKYELVNKESTVAILRVNYYYLLNN